MKKQLFLLQGISGSGKSTIAQHLEYSIGIEETCIVASADNFWYLEDGKTYKFDVKRLNEAHRWCRKIVAEAMKTETKNIIVDNTNLNQKVVQPYLDMAKEYGYEVRVIRVDCNINVAKEYNSQRSEDRIIPEHVIDRQYNSIERVEL